MPFGGIVSVLSLIVYVALAFVLVGSGNTKGIIDSLGSGFSNALKAATGR